MTGVESRGLLTLDGFRHQFEDGWTLVRPSGTEPKVRIMAEARDDARARQLLDAMTDIVRRCVA
jgi:phosphomannomutase